MLIKACESKSEGLLYSEICVFRDPYSEYNDL